MQKTPHPDNRHDHKDTASPKLPASSSPKQMLATAAAKDAHIKEAGLGGNRTGEVSQAVKRTQAARDAANETTPETSETSEPSQTSPDAEHAEAPGIQVQVNTDHNIHGSQKLNSDIESTVNASLSRFSKQLTRVEIHLSDDNGSKSHGDDKRCLLEARPAGHQPLVVTAVAATVDDAVNDAIEKMTRLLESTFGKLHDPKGRTSLGEDLAV